MITILTLIASIVSSFVSLVIVTGLVAFAFARMDKWFKRIDERKSGE